ncbi:MAG TPA: biotin-dependent carboxyltransferase family protein [Ktedonobacterales bacterium]
MDDLNFHESLGPGKGPEHVIRPKLHNMQHLSPVVNRFRVVAPGLLTTVQDLGRYGYERFGLSVAGALDDHALRWANLLAGNRPAQAVLEATLLGPTLVYEGAVPVVVALAGADCDATLNDRRVALWRSFRLQPGDTLALGSCQHSARMYLAVRGGFDVPVTLGSRSTDLMGHMGGIEGRALRAGDELPIRLSEPVNDRGAPLLALPAELIPTYPDELTVRVVLGPQEGRFTGAALAAFLSESYTVTPQTDRMGMRLAGPALGFAPGTPGADIFSEGVVTGAIQVPAHGQPIILLAGHQTTGGYAKIATVIGADLARLGQVRSGNRVRFQPVSVAQAQEARRAYIATFDSARLVVIREEPFPDPVATYKAAWTPQQEEELLKRAGSLGVAEDAL